MPKEINEEKVNIALEAWKTTVGVQQHFNTIEMQIRSIAVTVLTAAVGAAGLVYNQTQQSIQEALKTGAPVPEVNIIHAFYLDLSASDIIVLGGVFAWLAFYFMDRWWYHRLLKGSVNQGVMIEKFFKESSFGDIVSLGESINKASPHKLFLFFGPEIHSDTKIDLFYSTMIVAQILIICFVF